MQIKLKKSLSFAFVGVLLYDYKTFCLVFQKVGFEVELLEYCDKDGNFHYKHWNNIDGHIGRSYRYGTRNTETELKMVSIILDAKKPLIRRS